MALGPHLGLPHCSIHYRPEKLPLSQNLLLPPETTLILQVYSPPRQQGSLLGFCRYAGATFRLELIGNKGQFFYVLALLNDTPISSNLTAATPTKKKPNKGTDLVFSGASAADM